MGRKKVTTEAAAAAERTPRASTMLMAQCERTTGERVTMRVRNLSETGFGGMCTLLADFEGDEAVQIHFPHMTPIAAIIKWQAGKEAGVQFARKVDLKRIADARNTATAVPPPVIGLHQAAESFWQDAPDVILPAKRGPSRPVAASVWLPPSLKFGKRRAG